MRLPILLDRGLSRELAEQAITRTVSELEARIADPASLEVARFFALCGRPHRANHAERSAMPSASIRSSVRPAERVLSRSFGNAVSRGLSWLPFVGGVRTMVCDLIHACPQWA